MYRLRFCFLAILLIATTAAAVGQTASSDTQTLKALLAEVRQLRHDLQTTAATTQRVQIILYRLQLQQQTVARANQHLSDTRIKLSDSEHRKNDMEMGLKQTETTISSSQNPAEVEHAQEVLPVMKSRLEFSESEEQQAQSQEAEDEEQLRTEQAKLDELNDLLDRYYNALEKTGSEPPGSPQQAK